MKTDSQIVFYYKMAQKKKFQLAETDSGQFTLTFFPYSSA